MELSRIERWILLNQYRILEKLDLGGERSSALRQLTVAQYRSSVRD
jgi:uncharacterized protein YfbU (UPF0304 family)